MPDHTTSCPKTYLPSTNLLVVESFDLVSKATEVPVANIPNQADLAVVVSAKHAVRELSSGVLPRPTW